MGQLLVIDFSFQKVSAAGAKSSGYSDGIGYYSQDPTKNLNPSVVADYHSQGLGLGAIWETTAQRSLDGAAAGLADADAAITQALALGQPTSTVLWTNIGDFAATPDQIPAIDAYYGAWYKECVSKGFTATGGYGTGYIIDQLVARSRIGLWWQNAMNDQGEAGNVVSAHAFLYQRVQTTLPPIPGGGYDEDVVVVNAIPWWTGTAPAPTPIPTPTPAPTPPAPTPPPPVAPAFPLPVGQWYGAPSPDPRNHSGYYNAADRPHIAQFQQQLKNRGWNITVDGLFGNGTLQVVLAFQREKHLTADGKVGPQTWSAIWLAPLT